MSIGFVIGRAGTGKTRHCLGRIQQLLRDDPVGPPVFWIVPRQATFSAERMLLAEHGPFCRCRILSFDRLGDEVLGATGGVATTAVSARGRQMILGLLLRELQRKLSHFAPSARRVGLARELDHTFSELERSGTDLNSVVNTLLTAMTANPGDADTETLLVKSRDLQLIYNEYTKFLGERLDPHRRLERVLQLMAECSTFRGSTVFIDSFTDFTRHERQMIRGLTRACHEVTVALTIDPKSIIVQQFHKLPDELSLFHKTERTYSKLMIALTEDGATIRKPVALDKPLRYASPALKAVERYGFDHTPSEPLSVDVGVMFVTAPDRPAEVDAVALRVRDLQAQGIRLRDMVVLVRNLDAYQPLIATSFREHGIPLFIDARRSAVHHPLLQWLRSVFAIALNRWPHEDVIALLKTGLAGVTFEQADEIENYTLHHSLTRDAWEDPDPWAYVRGSPANREDDNGEPDAVVASNIDRVRQELLAKIKPFLDVVRYQPKLTFKQICSELFRLFDAFKVRKTLAEWIEKARGASQLELAAEHEQTWTNLVELFDELVDLLGDHEVTMEDFVQTLEAGQERFDFALTPPTLDQIEVGTVDRSRAMDAKVTIVLGLAEGEFPVAGSEPTVLTDTDRGLLRRRSIELDDDTARRLLDERLLSYLAFTRSSQRLILTRPSSDEKGKPLNPSPFWLRIESIFGNIGDASTLAPCFAHDKPECIATPRQLVTGLMRWARRQAVFADAPESNWASLYNAMARHSVNSDVAIKLRHVAWPALSYVNEAELSPEVAKQLFPSPLRASVRRIETYAACPFKHFAQFGLQLDGRRARQFSVAEAGQAYHSILDELVTDLLKSKTQLKDLTEAQTSAKISAIAEIVTKELEDDLLMSTARNRYLFKRIERTLSQVIASQRELAQRQTLRPSSSGVKFGSAEDKLKAPTINTPAGRQVLLHGKIDRLDRVPDTLNYAIIDYKSGKAQLSFQEVYHGLALQLLAYMLVLRENQVGQKRCTPIGAFYYRVTRSLTSLHPSEAPEPGSPEFLLAVKPRGILHCDYVQQFDQQLDSGASMTVNVSINKGGGFGRRDYSDVADAPELDRLLDYVKQKIAVLADDLMAGEVKVQPYRLGKDTPCSGCDYRSVCRFEVGINRYHTLTTMKRSSVMQAIGAGGDTDA